MDGEQRFRRRPEAGSWGGHGGVSFSFPLFVKDGSGTGGSETSGGPVGITRPFERLQAGLTASIAGSSSIELVFGHSGIEGD